MSYADWLIADLLKADVELSVNRLVAELPSVQKEVLKRCLSHVFEAHAGELEKSKLVTLAQSILAGTFPQVGQHEALAWLGSAIAFAMQETDSEIRGGCATLFL